MVDTQDIAIYEHTTALTPREEIQGAKQIADALIDMVRQTGASQRIGDKEYLQVEAWQFIGTRFRTGAKPVSVELVYDDDGTAAYIAEVQLVQDGIVVGGAFSFCGLDEYVAQGKKGWAARNAAASMAQTRATSKAFRLKYSWVAMLAGYQPTPAEEMTGERTAQARAIPANLQYWCAEHQTNWFKSRNMRNYAHPIQGSNQWCNMPSPEAPSGGGEQRKDSPPSTGARDVNTVTNATTFKRYMDAAGISLPSSETVLAYKEQEGLTWPQVAAYYEMRWREAQEQSLTDMHDEGQQLMVDLDEGAL